MDTPSSNGEAGTPGTGRRPAPALKIPVVPFRRPRLGVGMAERVATEMIARHGADAAREAAVRLNRMIDRGNIPARDLWACVVHLIHERRRPNKGGRP
jgi:hypothetical protein